MRQWVGLSIVLLAGCSEGITTSPSTDTRHCLLHARESRYNPDQCGIISGAVCWSGPVPTVPPIATERFIFSETRVEHGLRPNPHAPVINDRSTGLVGAVVFLRGVDAAASRPWNHPPVAVDVSNDLPIVRQGNAPPRAFGFVRRGETVTFVSKQKRFHSLRARNAAFFTLMLPDPDKPRRRILEQIGHVELSSAAGDTAIRGHLFVDDHPYYSVSDQTGRFQLNDVPAGEYELVCWHPNWRIERQERDPETLVRVRLFFRPPIEQVHRVTVRAGETTSESFAVGAE